ncbi:hypothetical protein ABZ912_28365 [Nonomuraea angiospora]|uniref:hypothetical protein n=1 Tax=Nonomuraea angiospora TaxID=46172 RepID=UPI0033EDAF1C
MTGTTVGVLRVSAPPADAWRARATGRLVAAADLVPAALPPSAILVVRSLTVARSMSPRPWSLIPPADWERDCRDALDALLARAAAPLREPVPAAVPAVVFADTAELVAGLLIDVAEGVAWDRWWWREAAAGHGGTQSTDAVLAADPRIVPHVLRLLARLGRAVPVLATVSDVCATGVLDGVLEAWDVRCPPRAGRAVAGLGPGRTALLGVSLVLAERPELGRSPSFPEAVASRLSGARVQDEAPDRHRHAVGGHSGSPSTSTPPGPPPPDTTSNPPARGNVPDPNPAPGSGPDPGPASGLDPGISSGSGPALGRSLGSRAGPAGGPGGDLGGGPGSGPDSGSGQGRGLGLRAGPGGTDGHPDGGPGGGCEGGLGGGPGSGRTFATRADRHAGRTPETSRRAPSNGRAPAVEHPRAMEAASADAPDRADAPLPRAARDTTTGLAGALYLINLFTRPHLHERFAAGWRGDPGWPLVEALARGILAATPPPDRTEARDPLWASLRALRARGSRSPRVTIPTVLGGLADVLAVEPQEVAGELLRRPGHLSITTSHVDLTMPLTAVSIRVRLAGLDADPGWVPVLGRVVAFKFAG